MDLVNDRAKLVLGILGVIKCGYLLLGDKCQAIYDYACDGKEAMNSVGFYERLGELLPKNAKGFELVGNRRQTEELSKASDSLRRALLNLVPKDANRAVASELSKIPLAGRVLNQSFDKIAAPTAILCRNNGEAEYISDLLHKKGIQHNLLRGVQQNRTLKRFIADCLWDYHADTLITRKDFANRYRARVVDDEASAYEAFDALSYAAHGDAKDFIVIEELAGKLCRQTSKLPEALINQNTSLLTVSTIHKAKGREFDAVYLIDGDFSVKANDTEEARVWYVGFTRAKKQIHKLSKPKGLRFRRSKTDDARWVQTIRHKWNHPPGDHCSNVVLGLPADFSEAGFVKGDLAQALDTQDYIACEVSVGDPIEVVLAGEAYQAKHNGNVIGHMDGNMRSNLHKIARESNPRSGAPPCMSNLYVANIVTITPYRFPDDVPPYFRKSKFWLGVELTGFPNIDWYYNKS